MSTDILKVVSGEYRFSDVYPHIKQHFEEQSRFVQIDGRACLDRKSWPSNPGVYLVWEAESLIYIGMTGKVQKSEDKCELPPKGSGLRDRLARWDPYCFDEQYQVFRYGLARRAPSKKTALEIGYETEVQITNIRVDCFKYLRSENKAPALLESILLQGFINQYDQLPVVNNAF